MSRHSPPPFKTLPDNPTIIGVASPDNPTGSFYQIASTTDRYTGDRTLAVANAEFIVRACNSHDDLLAAIKELERCSVAQDQQSLPDEREFWSAVGQARAAIAKAEGRG